jgi:LmbE family N-acetylglucosaminyl deacetylase
LPHRLLCVTAHPDDESGAFGGALLLAHQAGAETRVLCFTDGQAAHFRGEVAAGENLGRVRRAEMAAACAVLGVTGHEVLHFPDGALAQQSFQEMVGVVVDRIRRWRPHVVLTFGADGGVNLHRDHTTISAVATAAFHWAVRAEMFRHPTDQERSVGTPAGDPAAWQPHKLYLASTPFVSVRDHPELTLDLRELAERKAEAFSKHHTQQGVLMRVGKDRIRHMKFERYLLAAKRGVSAVTEDVSMLTGIPDDEG